MRSISFFILIFSSYLLTFQSTSAQTISTVAGNGTKGYSGDDSLAINATLNQPADVCADAAGNIYIADQYNNRIRKIDAGTGKIKTIAGIGTAGYSGDSAFAVFESLYSPIAIAVDSAGENLYISDCLNSRIRKVNFSTGWIVTIAGDSTSGYSGDGGLATKAKILYPAGITVDKHGNVYFSDFGNDVIRKIDASTGIITTIAGNGSSGYTGDGGPATSAKLLAPSGVAVDAAGNLYIADEGNNRIRKVTASTGIITTVAGKGSAGYSGDGSLAINAEFNGPQDIFIDAANNLYITDVYNSVVRRIDATTYKISTIAGNGSSGYSGDGGKATSAEMHSPMGLCVANTGDIYIADQANNVVRKVSGVLGITDINKLSFQVFPNPSAGIFSITLDNRNSPYDIKMYNSDGKLVYTGKNNRPKANINLAGLATGSYLVRIQSGNATATQEIIISH
ncbi:MAG: T9SS type A sorting domain-containing protein [Flavipsychrobacter sp.]